MNERLHTHKNIKKAWAIFGTGIIFSILTVIAIFEVEWLEMGYASGSFWRLTARTLTGISTLWILFSLYWLIHCYEYRIQERERMGAEKIYLQSDEK